MVVQNYPETFIKQSTSTTIPTTQIVEEAPTSPDTSSSKIGQRVITQDMTQREKNKIRRELRREGLDVDKRSGQVVPKGYYYTNTGQLRKQGAKYDVQLVETTTGKEILTTGKVPSEFLQRQVQRYEATQPQQTSRDVVYTSEGVGTSKAYELQTPTEKVTTSKFTGKLISTKEGIIYYGDNNGEKDTIQRPYTTTTNSYSGGMDSSNNFQFRSYNRYNATVPRSISSQETTYNNKTLYNYEFKDISLGQQSIKEFQKGTTFGIASGTTLGLISTGFGAGKGIIGSIEFFSPYSFTEKKFQVPVYTPTKQFIKSIPEIPAYAKSEPFEFTGQIIGGTLGGKVLDVGVTRLKSGYVALGSKYVPEGKVFSSQVLTEGKKFPLATSTEQSLQRFNIPTSEGKIVVSTASPTKIKGTEVGAGPRAVAGLEDPGIYVAPKGEGSPAFLGITKEAGYQVTLNPLKPVKEFFRTPGVTEFEVRGVVKQPRAVVSQPGFTATKQFFETEGSKTGYAYITKRSEIGQGELLPQRYTATSGKKILEQGTTEIEAVVPFKAKFEYETPKTFIGRLKGFEEYTTFEGRNIPIRKATLIGETGEGISLGKVGTVESAYKESSYALSNTRSISPASSLKYSISPTQSNISSISRDISKDTSSSIESSSKSFSSATTSLKSDIPKVTSTSISETSITSTPSSTPSQISTSSISVSEYPTTPSITSYKPPTPKYTPPNYPTPTFDTLETPKKKKGKAKLYVKRKGVFELKGISEDVGLLFKKGYDITRQTASASFKVATEQGEAIKPGILPTGFTRSKKSDTVIVQKREFRIGTAGEKFEITRKGIEKRRAQRLI